MGFCFGAGRLALGFSLLFLGVIGAMVPGMESRWKQHLEAVLIVVVSSEELSEKERVHSLEPCGYRLSPPAVKITEEGEEVTVRSPLARIAAMKSWDGFIIPLPFS